MAGGSGAASMRSQLFAGGVEADLNLETSQGSPTIKLWEFSLHTIACFFDVFLGSFMIL